MSSSSNLINYLNDNPINDLNLNDNNYNYLEINIIPYIKSSLNLNKYDNLNIINTDWKKSDFYHIINFLQNKNIKFFEKQTHVIKTHNLSYIYEIAEKKYHTQRLELNEVSVNNNSISLKYNKEILQAYHFPSTDKIMDEYYINQIIYKITNHLYLNFEIIRKWSIVINDYNTYYRIYFNFNNNKQNIDYNNIKYLLTKNINILNSIINKK